MKKVLIAAVMTAFATTSFAQPKKDHPTKPEAPKAEKKVEKKEEKKEVKKDAAKK